MLAALWPHEDAQHCHPLRISEYCFGSSTAECAGSRCAYSSLGIR